MKHPASYLKVLVPFLLLPGADALAQQIAGRVTDASTSGAVQGATVADSRGEALVTTDADGRFTLPCKGAMTIDISKYGYHSSTIQVSGCDANIDVRLTPGFQSLGAFNIIGTPETDELQKPQSTTTLTTRQLNRGPGITFDDAFNLTPGVRMERRTFGGGQRIIMRGYSNDRDAGNFIGTGYKAYLNGIPITDAEGQTMLDDIDFATVGRVSAIRGPASSLYGGGIGGVLNLYTATPDRIGNTISQNTTAGEDGLLRSDTRFEHASTNASIMVNVGHQKYDSYRVNSESKKDFLTFLGDFRLTDNQRVSAYLGYANSHDDRAGELDSAQFAQKLNTGEAKYIANHARSVVEGFRAGVTHSITARPGVQNTATIYASGNDYEDVSSGGGYGWKTAQNFGIRNVLSTDFTVGERSLHGVTGGEFIKTNRTAQAYPMTNSIMGGIRSDMVTLNSQYNLFTQWDLALPQQFTLTAGASLNFVAYTIQDRLANTANPTHKDGSGNRTLAPVVTPTISLNKVFNQGFSAYASVSQGYQSPTSGDVIIPYTGEPNDDLKPEKATQYEIGTKGVLQNGKLIYQVSLYHLAITDKLSPQAVFNSSNEVLYSYTVNAGDQSDNGLEVAASYALIQGGEGLFSLVRPFVSYTHADYKYKDFKSDNNNNSATVDYTDKHVVGVAPNVINAGLDVELKSGLYGNLTYHKTDAEPVSYDNLHHSVAFSLLDAKIGYSNTISDHITLDVSAGGQNLTNSLYFTQVFLNHKWDGAVPPNMYLPGPYTAKYYGALKLSYRL